MANCLNDYHDRLLPIMIPMVVESKTYVGLLIAEITFSEGKCYKGDIRYTLAIFLLAMIGTVIWS